MRVCEKHPVLTVAITANGAKHLNDPLLRKSLSEQTIFVLDLLQEGSYNIETRNHISLGDAFKLSAKQQYLTVLSDVLVESILTVIDGHDRRKRFPQFVDYWIAHVNLIASKMMTVRYSKKKDDPASEIEFGGTTPYEQLENDDSRPEWVKNIVDAFTPALLEQHLADSDWEFCVDDLLPDKY